MNNKEENNNIEKLNPVRDLFINMFGDERIPFDIRKEYAMKFLH